MEMPEIQYQPAQVDAQFKPVTQGDIVPALREQHQITQQQMNEQLQQLQRNNSVKLQNVKDQAFPVAELAQFSKTLEGLLQERIDQKKEDDQAEGAMLAFTEGMGVDADFDAREAEIEKNGKAFSDRADAYEMKTGDIETAERVRSLSGWKKYGYAKAKMGTVGKGFGAWMDSNAANPEFGVNVEGQVYTLSNAPNAAIRQAVAAKMASSYIQPYSGMNKSFLGKYLYPQMQQGMASSVAKYAAANAKLMKENRLDAAQTAFRGSPTPESMMELDRTLRLDGYDNKTIRAHIADEMVKVRSTNDFERLMQTPYGPNGQSFQEQYPQEAAELRVEREQFLQRGVQADEMERSRADRTALNDAKNTVAKERSDGSFDADPRRLEELSEQAAAAGLDKTAAYWQGQISETAFMKNSTQLKEQYEGQIQAGIIPSDEEILQSPALSQEDKQALLNKSRSSETGGAAPNTELAKGHKKVVQDSIRSRAKTWSTTGANDPGVAAMEMKAWKEYTQKYNEEMNKHGDAATAAQVALNDFNKKFGSDKGAGPYAVYTTDNMAPGSDPNMMGNYKGYDRSGNAPVPNNEMTDFRKKVKAAGGDYNAVVNGQGEMYTGEKNSLTSLSKSFQTSGTVGTVPQFYYQLQQMSGGHASIFDMLNKRLKANGLDELPKELNNVIKPVEDTFDNDTYAYINYKPNFTRTDIGLISSGQEPIYGTSLPTNVASDTEFQQEVSAVAGRLGISEADLMAVMSFETGGTFNPSIPNAVGSGATGLIQFMPSTARGLGTTTQALAQMSRAEQMQYVEKYLSNKGVKGKGLSDVYMAVLFPAAVGQSDDFVLFGNGATVRGYGARSAAYRQNKGLDTNGDGSVTKAEAAAKVLRHRHPQPWRRPNNMRPELR